MPASAIRPTLTRGVLPINSRTLSQYFMVVLPDIGLRRALRQAADARRRHPPEGRVHVDQSISVARKRCGPRLGSLQPICYVYGNAKRVLNANTAPCRRV